jgi:ElaB/YqjD/DUF883 family membrane-anchored ribosome-binding protein
MKKIMGLGAMLLAGFLVIPGNLGLTSQVLAQSDSQTDKQMQDIRQKRQETLQEQEREAEKLQNTGQRKQDAVKRQQDAIKRQKAAGQSQQDLDEEDN